MRRLPEAPGAVKLRESSGKAGGFPLGLSGNAATNSTISGVISDSGGITKSGSGTWTLTRANTYTGTTTINQGTLQVGANNNLGTGAILVDGGTLRTTNTFAITATRTVTMGTSGGTLETAPSTTLTYAGAIAGSGTLTKEGTGTFVTGGTGFNTWTGPLVVNAGEFQVAKQGFVGAIDNAAPVTVATGATLRLNGSAAFTQETIGTLSGGGLVVNSGAAAVNFVLSGASNTTFSGTISNTANALNLIKTGAGTQILSGNLAYTGTTVLSNGLLQIGDGSTYNGTWATSLITNNANLSFRIGDGTVSVSAPISGTGPVLIDSPGGTVTYLGSNTYTGGTLISNGTLQVGNGGFTGTLSGGNVTNNGGLVFNRDGTLTLTNLISGTGGLTNKGPGVTLLGGANTYMGDTTVNGGTLRLTNGGILGVGSDVTVSADGLFGTIATLDLNNLNASIGSLTLAGPTASGGSAAPKTTLVTSGTGTLTVGGDVLYNGDQGNQASSTIAGNLNLGGATRTFTVNGATNSTLGVTANITGAAGNGLTKTGGGVLSLGGSNSFDGNLAINQGTVALNNTNALAGGGTISFGGGTLRYSSNNAADVSSRIFNSSGAISIDTAGQNSSWATSLDSSNTNGLAKLGAGTLTFTAANNYTGDTAIDGGTLAISAANQLSSGGLSIGNATLLSLSNTYALANTNITLTGDGTIANLSGRLSVSNIANGGNMLTFSNTGDIAVTGVISGTGGMTKTGTGTLILEGANTFLGPVFLNEGAFRVSGNTAGFTNVAPGVSTVASGASILVEGSVPRGRPLILNGTGVDGQGAWQNLSGTNVQLGAVFLGSDTRIASLSGTMTLSNTLTGTNFNLTVGGAGNFVLNALALGVDADIIKDGTGTLTLAGPSDHEDTTILAGQLNVNNVIALGSSAGGTVTFGDGVKLDNTSGSGINVSVPVDINVGSSLEFVGTRSLGMGTGTLSLGSPDTNGYTTFNVVNNLLAFDGEVTGTSGIIKIGAGTLQLGYGGSNSFTGPTQVDGGELFVSGPGVSFNNQLFANTNGVIRLGAGVELPTNTVVLNGGQVFFTSLSDTPVVIAVDTILGTNALTWNGGLTISNGITVTNTGITDLLGFTPTNFVSDRVIFKADSKLVVTDGFTIGANKGIVIETNTVTFQVNTNDLLINSPISGAATLRKTGAGHIHLFGSNSYTGGTLIEEGWVGILNDNALGTGKVTLAGGVFEGGFEASPTNVLVTVDSNRIVEMVKGVTSTMIAQHNTTLRYDGNLAEVGTNSGPANLVIGLATVDGTVELGGTNNYTGFTRVQNGATLSVKVLADGGTVSGIGSSSSNATNLVLNGGTLRYTGGAVSTDRLFSLGNSGGTLDASGTGALDFTNTGTIGYNGQTGARNLNLAGSGAGSLAMVIGDNTGSTSLIKSGAGTWTLTATNTYTGDTTIGAGALRIGADANIGTGSLVFSTGSTGKLLVTNSIAMTRDVLLTGNGEINTVSGTATTVTGDVTGAGALAKSGEGTLVLSNTVANTWSGGTAINDGRLKMLTVQAVGTGNITNNGVFEIATTTSVPSGSSSNIFNTISGTGSVVRNGPAGVGISLSGTNDNTYTGLTIVNSGTLRLEKTAGAKAFGGNAEVNGGALIISGNEQTPTNATVTVNAGTFEFSPNIAGGNTVTFGTLDKNGGIIRTYGNTFNVASIDISGGGTNQINRNTDGSSGTILVRSGGSGLSFSGASTTTLDIASAASGVANRLVLQNDVTVNMTDGTAQILSTGGGSVDGAIDLDGGSRTFAVGNGSAETDMLVTAAIGNGTLAKTGTGRLSLGGNNSYSGGTTLSAGQLRLNTTNAAGTGTITQTSGSSTLEINAGGTVGNTMSVYNVAFVNGGSTLSGPITLNGGTVFTNVESGVENTITGQLAGTGGITKQGDGAIVIAGTASNSFTGATVIEGGSLILNNSAGGAIAGTSIQVDSGATLVLAADNQIGDTTGLILNGGTFLAGTDDAGYSETLGTLTLNADSVIDLGAFTGSHTLSFANSSAITWATNAVLTISNWQGIAWEPGVAGQILFGAGGLTSTQLAQVRWMPQELDGGGLIGGGGELVPIPEPRVYAAAVALLAAAVWRERKRLRALLRAVGKRG